MPSKHRAHANGGNGSNGSTGHNGHNGHTTSAGSASSTGTASGNGSKSLVVIARAALEEFQQITGLVPEAMTGARKEGDQWSLIVDVVELERVPTSISVMASYRVDADTNGSLIAYERLRRFTRATTDS